jgi:hypothetical protein
MKKIKCADCKFAVVDKNASEYTKKLCGDCVYNENCTCGKKDCKCRKGCKYRNTDIICPKQKIKWKAIQCNCKNSEYNRALLNVSNNGEKQYYISWSGCSEGVAK